MRRFSSLGLAFGLSLALICSPQAALAQTSLEVANEQGAHLSETYQPQGSIVTETHTGRILWAENMDKPWNCASLSKLMTVLLTYEAIDAGKISLNTEVKVDENVVKMCENPYLSNTKMKLGCTYTVSELLDLICIPSSASATLMLADLIEPDRAAYVDLMNKRAQELGMTDTHYTNPIGVPNYMLNGDQPPSSDPNEDNLSSARDCAILSGVLVNTYPDIINHSKDFKKTIKAGTPFEEQIQGHLFSLAGTKHAYPGCDGLKTGTSSEGYSYAATCKQNNTRLNEVILGVANFNIRDAEEKRHLIGNALYDRAYKAWEYKKVLSQNQTYNIDGEEVVIAQDLYDCVPVDFKAEDCVIDKKTGMVTTGVDTEFLPGYSKPSTSSARRTIFFTPSFNEDGTPTKSSLEVYLPLGIAAGVSAVAIFFIIRIAKHR